MMGDCHNRSAVRATLVRRGSIPPLLLLVLVVAFAPPRESFGFAPPTSTTTSRVVRRQGEGRAAASCDDGCGEDPTSSALDPSEEATGTRRSFFSIARSSVIAVAAASIPRAAVAASPPQSTADAAVTDKIYVEFKGLPSTDEGGGGGSNDDGNNRIVIGLFGNDAPQPVSILKKLVTAEGLPAPCKPRESRTLQREQLEANKVYNACIESESNGVTYDYSTVWRVNRDRRIDVAAVSGRYVARVNPTFEDGGGNGLRHDAPGVVSVRKGNDGGFGFTIYPGGGGGGGGGSTSELDEDNVVVGRVLSGMDVVARLNDLPVVQSANVNYMALTGGPRGQTAPSRACRYGGPMYCNELKPLKKVLISRTGML